ncbi:MAG TPA: hypothetical protein VI365_09870 [Trebonia sp.]
MPGPSRIDTAVPGPARPGPARCGWGPKTILRYDGGGEVVDFMVMVRSSRAAGAWRYLGR